MNRVLGGLTSFLCVCRCAVSLCRIVRTFGHMFHVLLHFRDVHAVPCARFHCELTKSNNHVICREINHIEFLPVELFQPENILLNSARSFSISAGLERMISTIAFAHHLLQISHRFFNLSGKVSVNSLCGFTLHVWYLLFTLSSRSGVGNSSHCASHSCSIVSSILRSFNRTNHNLCKSLFDFMRNSSVFHDRPDRTSFAFQFFGSSKNSMRSYRGWVLWIWATNTLHAAVVGTGLDRKKIWQMWKLVWLAEMNIT